MDDFTRTLLDLAYRECKRKRIKLTVANVRHEMYSYWANARDSAIATWAKRIAERTPRARLVEKLDTVFDLLIEAGIDWEWPWDEDEIVHTVAWGLATLRWLNWEEAGRTPPRPRCMDDEIEAWIAARETRQLSLWPELAQGEILCQHSTN
ncbi:MAG: hypothetical protein PVF45_06125 [Anaerolineae bacterium]|jgi:hypothetical protein